VGFSASEEKERKTMKASGRLMWLIVGAVLGGAAAGYFVSRPPAALAGSNDRHEDYVICTGTVSTGPKATTDGVWLLDYRAGKLLGTVIDKGQGKISGWAEVDLVNEFGLQPRANVHFMMTTGMVSANQAALYVAETTSGKFAVYTMGQRPDGQPGVSIKRHDLVLFRQAKN
jgi:hypothetical protein